MAPVTYVTLSVLEMILFFPEDFPNGLSPLCALLLPLLITLSSDLLHPLAGRVLRTVALAVFSSTVSVAPAESLADDQTY